MLRARHPKFVSAIRNPIEQLERRSLLAAISWDGGGDGVSWNSANNWSGNALPGVNDDVTINIGANPNITLTGDAASIRSLNSSENLKITGTSLTVSNGATLNAPTQVSGSSYFYVQGGLTTNNVLSLGDADNSYGVLQFNGPGQTLGGSGSVNAVGSNHAYIYNQTYNTTTSQGDALTIAPTIELNFGAYGRLTQSYGGNSIINNGQINVTGDGTAASDVQLANPNTSVVNNGSMSFTNGARVVTYNLTNNATKTITTTNSTLWLYDDGPSALSWDNNGTIVTNNTVLNLGGHFMFADLGTVNRTGGEVHIIGTLDNTSSTLTLNNTTGSWFLSYNGRILNGTIAGVGSNTLVARGGVIDNVTLNLVVPVEGNNYLYIENGLTLNASLTVGGSDDSWGVVQFQGTNPITVNGTGSIDAVGTAYTYIYNSTYDNAASQGNTVTLGSNIELNLKSRVRYLSNFAGGTLVNNGPIYIVGDETLSSDVQLGAGNSRVTNNGSITITNDAIVNTYNLVNNASRTISVTNSDFNLLDDGVSGPYSWDNNGTLTSTNSNIGLGGYFIFADIGTYNRTGGEVRLIGTLDNTGSTLTLNNTTGSWLLWSNGKILNGTVTTTGSNRLIPANGMLDNVVVNTPLNIDQSRYLYVQNGMTLNNVITLGNASDNSYGVVQFQGEDQSLIGTGSVDAAGTNYSYFYHYGWDTAASAGADLTVGASIELNLGNRSRVQIGYTGGKIILNGQMNITGDGTGYSDVLVANATTSFVNNGSITVDNNAYVGFSNLINNPAHTLTASNSTILLSDDGLNGLFSWDNNGTITFTNTHLQLGGHFVAADIGTISRTGGQVSIVGILDNTSATFTLSNMIGDVNIATYGRILGGTVAGPNKLFGRGGTLDGVTLTAQTVVDQYSYLYVEHGLTVNSTLTLGGANDSWGALQFQGNGAQALGGTGSIEHLGNATTYIYNYCVDAGVGTTLTIGSGIEINTAGVATITTGYTSGSIINNGVITIDGDNTPGLGTSQLGNPSTNFINNGTINAIRKAHVLITNLVGNANTLGTADLDTWLKIETGIYTINTLLTVASRSTMYFDGTWTRSASMNINGTAIFDHDSDGGATFSAVKSAVISGYAGGAWNGNGLRDSVAASTPKYTLGYATSTAILGPTGGNYNNLFVDEHAVIVHHTLDADFNMDNTVNFTDLLKLAQSYGLTNKNFTDGDVDFNGSVNFNDLLPVAQLYGQSSFSSTPITRMLDRESDSKRSIV